MPSSTLTCKDRRDLLATESVLSFPIGKLRQRLLNRWYRGQGEAFWRVHGPIGNDEFHLSVIRAVESQTPLAVGRLGGVEASILMWAEGAANVRLPIWSLFWDTRFGATNAGIRPRNPSSYKLFAKLCRAAIDTLDLQGVWMTGYEAICLGDRFNQKFFNVEIAAPDGPNPHHWLAALRQRRVLVVSPFQVTIEQQIQQLTNVWPGATWMEGTAFFGVRFPYLIDESCPEMWWEVYDRIGSVISQGDYDVALFGCGGLGLLFAKLAKDAGRVGMHLGGHLQLLFGIYGKRHLEVPWHRKCINDAWVRPESGEVAQTADRVEGGCYW